MKIKCMPFECKWCGNAWDEPFPLPMELVAVGKRVVRVRCPRCDAGHMNLKINWERAHARGAA